MVHESCIPYGFKGHDSLEKHQTSAKLAQQIVSLGCLISAFSYSILEARGYSLIMQERVGLYGDTFIMPKLQTMPSKHTKHYASPKQFDQTVQFIRNIAGDEFVQLDLVSLDPNSPGPMVTVSHRPQMDEELDDMEFALGREGKAGMFNAWLTDVYCAKRPGLLSNESMLDKIAAPGTVDYFEKRIQLGYWYQEYASPVIDHRITYSMLAVGAVYALHEWEQGASSAF